MITDHDHDTITHRRAYVLMILLTVIAYLPSLFAPVVYEDFATPIQSVSGVSELFTTLASRTVSVNFARMVVHASTAARINFNFSVHVAILLIHVLNGLMVGILASRLTRHRVWGGVAATVFLLHPVQTYAVAYAAAIADPMYTFWMLVACCAITDRSRLVLLRTHHNTRHVELVPSHISILYALVACWISAHSKEIGVISIPIVLIVAYQYWDLRWVWVCIRRPLRVLVIIPLLIVGVLLTYQYGIRIDNSRGLSPNTAPDYSRMEFASGQQFALNSLIAVTVIPLPSLQHVDIDAHDYAVTSLHYHIYALLIMFAACVILWLFRLGRAGFVITLIGTCVILRFVMPLTEWMTEYQWYAPMVAVSIGVAMLIDWILVNRPSLTARQPWGK